MDDQFKDVDAPKPPALTAENALSPKTKRKIGVARQLITQAMTLNDGRLCKGKVKLRDEAGEYIRDETGAVQTRPCKRRPIRGGTVCPYHGGKAPQVKKKAERRMLAMVEPALVELEVLYTQNDHLPTKLGAIRTVLERAGANAIGALSKDTGEKDTRPVINIGIRVGGIPLPGDQQQLTVNLPMNQIEGEVVGVSESDSE
jgi:hypothetical protein